MVEPGHVALLCLDKPPSNPGLGHQPLGPSSAPQHPNTGSDETPPSQGCNARQSCGNISGPHAAELWDTDDSSHLPSSAAASSTTPAVSESALVDARATETNRSLREAHRALAHGDILSVWDQAGSGHATILPGPTITPEPARELWEEAWSCPASPTLPANADPTLGFRSPLYLLI